MLRRIRKLAGRALGPGHVDEAELVYELLAPGVLMEIGAHTGDGAFIRSAHSGWEIHAFEPDPENCRELVQKTAQLPNVIVIPKAVGDRPGTMTLYRSDESSGISSLAAFTEGHRPGGEVEVTTVRDYVLTEHAPQRVDFLKIDVEGYERFVLAGYPWATHRPRAVMLEFEDRKTTDLGYCWIDLADELVGHGYSVLVSEWHPIMRYGVAHEWRRYVSYPTRLRDVDAWGNLIAVEPEIFPRLRRAAMVRSVQWKARSVVDRFR